MSTEQTIFSNNVYFSSNLGEIVPKFTLNFNTTNCVCVVDDLYCIKIFPHKILPTNPLPYKTGSLTQIDNPTTT